MPEKSKISYHKLRNGSTVILQPDSCRNTVTTMIMFKVGSRDEPPGFHGLAHFAEHMFFKATKNRPQAQLISQEVDQYGGIMNAMTDYDYTGYYIKINKMHYQVALDILSDMILNPLFRQEDIDFEKHVVGEELKIYRSNPNRYVVTLYTQMMFKGTTMEHDIGGDFPTINKATRNKFISFLHHFYRPDNMVISIAGDFNKTKTLSLVKKYFDHPFQYHPKNDISSLRKFHERKLFPNFSSMQKQARFNCHKFPKMKNIYLMLGFPGCRYLSDDYYICLVLAAILGGGMSSRLFVNVRERNGLVYTITADVEGYQDMGCISINAATSGNLTRLKKTITLILEQLSDIKTNGITKEELKKGQNFLIGQELMKRESTTGIAQSAAYDLLMMNQKYDSDRYFKQVLKVNQKDIQHVANKLFKYNRLVLSIIADTKFTKTQVLDANIRNIL